MEIYCLFTPESYSLSHANFDHCDNNSIRQFIHLCYYVISTVPSHFQPCALTYPKPGFGQSVRTAVTQPMYSIIVPCAQPHLTLDMVSRTGQQSTQPMDYVVCHVPDFA
jgi:hypothetical protein